MFEILLTFYSARSNELNNKGAFSYTLWIIFLFVSIGIFILHNVYAIDRLSIYMTVYPLFLLVWLSVFIYLHYKIKLLWNYLYVVEKKIIEFFNDKTEDKINANLKIPLWVHSNLRKIKTIQAFSDVFYARVEIVFIVFFTIIIFYPSYRGFEYIRNQSSMEYAYVTSIFYFFFICIYYVINIMLYYSLKQRIKATRKNEFFTLNPQI